MLKSRRLLRQKRASQPTRQRGIALLEALVAMLLFVLGILGLMGLQGTMTRAQTDAKMRADAVFLATEGVGRLWSDINNITAYDGASCAGLPRCKEWQDKVSQALPSGTGAVAVDAATGDVSVTISWSLPGGDTHRYVANTTVIRAGS